MRNVYILLMFVFLVAGCSNKSSDENSTKKSDAMLREFMNQQYDHRSLAERIKDSKDSKSNIITEQKDGKK